MTDPLVRIIVPVCALLGMGTHACGEEGLVALIEGTPWASAAASAAFGSAASFSWLVVRAWYLTVVAHGAEAAYAAYECKRRLKMTAAISLRWFVLVFATGYPVTRKVMELVEVDKAAKSSRKKA